VAVTILLNESVGSNRCVPLWCVQSNGTSACTNESGATFNFEIGGVYYGSGGSLSAVSANIGLYTCIFSASKLSVPGVGQVMYSSGTALPVSAPFVVIPPMFNRLISVATCSAGGANTITLNSVETTTADQYSGMGITVQYRDGTYQDNVIQKYSAARVATVYNSWVSVPVSGMTYWLQPGGAHAWSTSTISGIAAGTYSGVTLGAGNFAPGVYSGVSFSIRDSGIATTSYQLGNYSGVSVEVKNGGIQTSSVGAGSYSGVSLEIKTGGIQTNSIGSATYSGVTLGANPVGDKTLYSINSIVPGSYSGVSVEVKTGGIQAASVGKGVYSGVSVEVTTGGIQVASVGAGTYSGVTFGINNIAPNVYSGVTIDGAKLLSTAGERSIASSLLSTSLGGTTPRLVQHAFELLRNKVTISGSTMTVFKSDDVSSSWTATISTGTATVYGVAPGLA